MRRRSRRPVAIDAGTTRFVASRLTRRSVAVTLDASFIERRAAMPAAPLIRLVLAFGIAIAFPAGRAAGFQHATVADPEGKPLEVGIWYPSRAAVAPLVLGPTTMAVALDGPVDRQALPLVVMSHGTGSSDLGHYDTAIALADAGYVVAAVTHTGDHWADRSRSLFVMDRPRQVSRVVDHLLSGWSAHAQIDPRRIGVFGFSAGGFTALVMVGGVPDLSTIGPMCARYPADFACRLIAGAGRMPDPAERAPGPDRRIRAAVVAAPALGFTFAGDGLKGVTVPVQLWRAENDTVLPHPRYAEAVRQALPIASDYHVVAGAGHFDFLAPCSDALAAIAPVICASAPGFDRSAFHRSFDAAVVRFFDAALPAR